MKWGNISDEFCGFGWKRLSGHEIDPKVSNGHEFQGVNALRELLGTTRKDKFSSTYYLIGDDGEDSPVVKSVIQSYASWYDAREKNPNRNPEYRLYYPEEAGAIQSRCSEGDLMITGLRKDGSLAIMLIEAGTVAETGLINLLMIDEAQGHKPGMLAIRAPDEDIGLSGAELLATLANSTAALGDGTVPPPFPSFEISTAGDRSLEKAEKEMLNLWPGPLGPCMEVAGVVMTAAGYDDTAITSDPDEVLLRWLEISEASYRTWEKSFLDSFFEPLRFDRSLSGSDFVAAVSRQWMSLRQSRVSRAGQMMEIFIDIILKRHQLHFERGARIEGNRRPDFLFPGTESYNNPAFPSEQLRILGAKTSLKERWRQILAEGGRVSVKHGITRDPALTCSTLDQMRSDSFVVVMPKRILRSYQSPRSNQISLMDFIHEVKSLQFPLT